MRCAICHRSVRTIVRMNDERAVETPIRHKNLAGEKCTGWLTAAEGEEGNAGSGPAADGATTIDADPPGVSGTSSTQTDEVEEKPAKGKK